MRLFASIACLALAGGCAAPRVVEQQSVETAVGPAPARGSTPIDGALHCLAERFPPNVDLRLAVNDLTDGTGSTTADNALSKVLTQRPDVMMTIGLAKTGVPMVNRSSTGVAEWELRQSMQKYIGDGRPYFDPGAQRQVPYRQVLAGSLLGSTHYVSGALTELNWNIQSDVNEVGIGGLTLGRRSYRISIGADLIVTNSRTTEIVMARSYSKQLVGRETAAGLFRFFDVGRPSKNFGRNEVFEFNLGRQANEPVQAAVRWMLETAAYDIVSELAGVGDSCDPLVPEDSRPQRGVRGARLATAQSTPPAAAQSAPPAAASAPRAGEVNGVQGSSQGVSPSRLQAGATNSVRAPAKDHRSATEPAAAAANAVPNLLTGLNLLDDSGVAVLRVDTRRPLERLPALEMQEPNRLRLVFQGMRSGIGTVVPFPGPGVRRASLQVVDESVVMELELDGGYTPRLVNERRALLLQLLPRNGRAAQVLPANAPDTSAPVPEPARPAISPSAAGSPQLTPRQTNPSTPEDVFRIIQP